LLGLLVLAGDTAFAQGKTAQISYLEGKATRRREGKPAVELRQGTALGAGDFVETREQARLEIRFSDESVLRLGPKARMQLTEAHFASGPARRRMTAKLFFGQIWAKVTSAIQGSQKFQIETENAVAGVRGTTFRVDARGDKSVLVRVYAGAVAVAKNVPLYQTAKPGEERREVEGPEEVSRDQWEKIVAGQMQILIGADGTPGEPERFSEDADRDDSFARWNQERDAK
jgi:hypothetical protein